MLRPNNKKRSLWIIALLFGAALAQTAQANETFDFSFSNTIGPVNGTVSGYVVLPNLCTGCTAIDLELTSFPSGLDSLYGGPPIDATTAISDIFADSFTISSGAITAADYSSGATDGNEGALELNFGGDNGLELNPGPLFVLNENGLSGVTFKSAVPEPNSVSLMSIALLAAVLVVRKRKAPRSHPSL